MKVKELINEASDDIITYSVTYEITTPDSTGRGDIESGGYVDQDVEADFQDMVSILEGAEPSIYPPSKENARSTWYTKYDVNVDYETGAHESNNYHGKSGKDKELMFDAWKQGNNSKG